MKRFIAAALAALLFLSSCSGAENEASPEISAAPPASQSEPAPAPLPPPAIEPEPEPDNAWQTGAPSEHGMEPEMFDRLHIALSGSNVYAMLTAKDGVIIDEYYREGYDENSLLAIHSCSKSFTGALIGIAIEQGYIGGEDDLLSVYLPQVLEQEDARKHLLTLRHLLTQTSGLEWYEWGGSSSNWEEFRASPNWVEYILGRRLVTEPGAAFNYSTGNTHLLTAALESAVGMSAYEYAKENIFDPCGMDSVRWGTDPQGVVDGGNGIELTARDAARFGQLFLNGGSWNGEQLVPADWLELSTTVQNSGAGDGTGSYGYQWWIRPFGSGSYDTYYAFGAWGQYIFVVPELDLVCVIASEGPQNSYAPRPFFTDYVLAAHTG